MLIETLKRLVPPDSIIFDIGSNNGDTAFILDSIARPNGRVVCFEPNTDVAIEILTRFPSPRKILIERAAWDEDNQMIEFRVGDCNQAGTVCDASHLTGKITERRVPTITVDTVAAVLGHPSLIKVDCEGAELEVLNGARSTLIKAKPILSLELAVGTSRSTAHTKRVADLLKTFGYVLFVERFCYDQKCYRRRSGSAETPYIEFQISDLEKNGNDVIVDLTAVHVTRTERLKIIAFSDYLFEIEMVRGDWITRTLKRIMPEILVNKLVKIKRRFIYLKK